LTLIAIANSPLEVVGNAILNSLLYYPKLKLMIVMVIVPLIMNALQFWLIDNILKFKPKNDNQRKTITNIYHKEEEDLDRGVELTNKNIELNITDESNGSNITTSV
jgi:hypothetical protein